MGSVNPIHNNKLILLLVENMAAVMTSGPEMKSTDPAWWKNKFISVSHTSAQAHRFQLSV